MSEQGIGINQEASITQPSIEQRALLLKPDEFVNHLMWRRQRYASLITKNTNLKYNNEQQIIEHEIETLSERAKLLSEDNYSANQETIRERLTEVEKKLKTLGKDIDPFTEKGLEIRKQLLESRKAFLYANGPTIKTVEGHRWKTQLVHNGKALPLDQWGVISPRLLENSEVNLDEKKELAWYLSKLSPQRLREVRSLTEQMQPIDINVRAVVVMPGHKEGKNIYCTLMNYIGQTELNGRPFDYKKVRFVVFDNWPEGTTRDQTGAEVRKFIEKAKEKHPDLQIDYVKGVIAPSAKKIANIRNIITSAVIANAETHRKKPTTNDLILVSNDADMPEHAVKSTYLADIIDEFDTHPYMDALAGKIDMPEKLMVQVPVQFATRRLWQYMDTIQMHKKNKEPFLVGRNSAMRLKIIAAVGNYDPVDEAGEDVEIGNKIKWVRSWDKEKRIFDKGRIKRGQTQESNRIRYVHKISIETDPRRDIVRMLGKERIKNQYSAFEKDQSVRGKQGEELIHLASQKGYGIFDRGLFEKEASVFYYDSVSWAKWGGLEIFDRAMGLLGVKYEIKNGELKLTDTTVLERGLHEQEFRQLHQQKIEEILKTRFKRVDRLKGGVNNRVFSVVTSEGKNLIIRMSTQERNKFQSEAWVIAKAANNQVPVPKIIFVDGERKNIPGWTISISEKVPGKTLTNYEEKREADNQYLMQIGRALKKIHSIPISKGYGYINNKGEGEQNDWESFVLRPCDKTLFTYLINQGLVNRGDIELAIQALNQRKHLLHDIPRQIVHGDFSLANTLRNNSQLSGVLDFENALSGDPLWDIAHFSLYDEDNIIPGGLDSFLQGYGQSNLLTDKTTREKFNIYKLSDILYSLKWLGESKSVNKEDAIFLSKKMQSVLAEINFSQQKEIINFKPINQSEIDNLLKSRFNEAAEWFRDFYHKGLREQDQEYKTALDVFQSLTLDGTIPQAIQTGDLASKDKLFRVLRKDETITLSDNELKRQIDRLTLEYKKNPTEFSRADLDNPAYRFIVYARNRGSLARYIKEYGHLAPKVDFMTVVKVLAQRKTTRGEVFNILDEGGTFDKALQELAEVTQEDIPTARVKLSSIAADDMAVRFSDCHRLKVEHKIADAHKLDMAFPWKKQSLIISSAAYKFFWDPLGVIVKTANALEKGGWAFLGDLQENVSYEFNKLFIDENGKVLDPVLVIDSLNSLNLGYRFYVGSHTITEMGDRRQVLTVAVEKQTDKDLNLPLLYGRREKSPFESNWRSPLVYIFLSDNQTNQRHANYIYVS